MKRFILILLSCSQLISILVYAQNSSNISDELQEREQLSLELFSEINNLSEKYGRFMVVRDNYLYGTNGILQKYTNCHTDIKVWLKKWENIFEEINFRITNDANAIHTKIHKMLIVQALNTEKLKKTCLKVQEDYDVAIKVLENASIYNTNILFSYKYILTYSENMQEKLIRILGKYTKNSNNYIDRIDQIVDMSYKGIYAKYKVELRNNEMIPFKKTLTEIENILSASKTSDSTLAKIELSENLMRKYTKNYQYFNAKKLIDQIKKECINKKNELNKIIATDKYLIYNFNRLNSLCSNSQNYFDILKQIFQEKHEYIFNYLKVIKLSLNINCSNNNHIVPCNKLSIINSLNKEELKKIPEYKLAFIEDQLKNIHEEYKK